MPQSPEGIKEQPWVISTRQEFLHSPHPSKNMIPCCPFPWSDMLLLHQTILGMHSGKPEAFLPHYLSFPRNEEQILFPSSLNCIRMLPRKCKKKHLCPQPTSKDTWSVQLFRHQGFYFARLWPNVQDNILVMARSRLTARLYDVERYKARAAATSCTPILLHGHQKMQNLKPSKWRYSRDLYEETESFFTPRDSCIK